ncbi:MAG: MBL fold metallo-hydrolase RNA specificity domain-containing protein [Gemmatimonadota bacterium]
MRLISAGAAGTVTGSCHLLEIRDRRILVDCGVFQGAGLEALNHDPFPFDPTTVDAVLVTHGHNDHVGRLPLLVHRGYKGPIHAARATREITEIILLDAAKLQSEDYDRALRHARKGRSPEDEVTKPLYVAGDVTNTIPLFRDVDFDRPLDLGAGITATFRPAGHILGSAFLEIRTPDGVVVASGDLGNRESGIHTAAVAPPECDAVLIETTYGDRRHRTLEATVAEFQSAISQAAAESGIILVPTFAVERTQAVLYHLKQLMDSRAIPAIPVFLDSPMAAKMTRLYEKGSEQFVPEISRELDQGKDPFEPKTLSFVVTVEESRRLNDLRECAIVLAGSGMMTGGRILHHLEHHLMKERTHLIVVGYQGEGTLGRRLVDGADRVRIHGKEIEVRAQIHTINGFSAHADQDDLIAWLEPTGSARVYMVHGEPPVMHVFADLLRQRGREAVQVERGRPYELG